MAAKKTMSVTLAKGKVCNSVTRYEGGTASDPFTNAYVSQAYLNANSDPAKLAFTVTTTARTDGYAVKLTAGKDCRHVIRYEGGTASDPVTNVYMSKDALEAMGNPTDLYFSIEAV
jgi:hypothetical protein